MNLIEEPKKIMSAHKQVDAKRKKEILVHFSTMSPAQIPSAWNAIKRMPTTPRAEKNFIAALLGVEYGKKPLNGASQTN